MTPREQAKERNREKIKEAAERIIRQEGIEKLTMRHLAQQAEVSLRTPYNLFGSKTELLIALLDEALEQIAALAGDVERRAPLVRLFQTLDDVAQFFRKDEAFYREIYWAIMTSDQAEARLVGYNQLIALIRVIVHQAVEAGELERSTDAAGQGEHLAILMMAVVGMWGGGLLGIDACQNHVRKAWRVAIEAAATKSGRRELETFFAGAGEKKSEQESEGKA